VVRLSDVRSTLRPSGTGAPSRKTARPAVVPVTAKGGVRPPDLMRSMVNDTVLITP
jgi:hypothetical protein